MSISKLANAWPMQRFIPPPGRANEGGHSLVAADVEAFHDDAAGRSDGIAGSQYADEPVTQALCGVTGLGVGKHQRSRAGQEFEQADGSGVEPIGNRRVDLQCPDGAVGSG